MSAYTRRNFYSFSDKVFIVCSDNFVVCVCSSMNMGMWYSCGRNWLLCHLKLRITKINALDKSQIKSIVFWFGFVVGEVWLVRDLSLVY